MPARPPLLSRLLSVAVVCIGLFTVVLGAGRAPAQEARPQAAATQTPAAAASRAEPTATVAPATTAGAAARIPSTSDPAAATESTPATTAATPAPAATPDAEATPGATATPEADSPRKRPRTRKPEPETCLETPDGVIAGAEAGLAGSAGDATKRSGALPTQDSTPTRECGGESDESEAKKKKARKDKKKKRSAERSNPTRTRGTTSSPAVRADGSPAPANPGYALATPGPARVGVPNFFIEKFRIPPFLLPIYQAAGTQYGIRWELLAAINEIETDYGRNLNVSTAGAQGWMQFMPASWRAYGVDANRDGNKDPYNPVDAIFAAARYLRAAGGEKNVRKAVFAYNHADWYVDSVLMRARLIGGLPVDFTVSLTGLTQGRFPVHARSTYAGQVRPGKAERKIKQGNAAFVVASDGRRRGIDVFARRGAPVVAVNDGRILGIGRTERLGRFVRLQDVYGNVFTYGHLGQVARTYPAPRERKVSRAKVRRELKLPRDPEPKLAASAGRRATKAGPAAKPKRPVTPKPAEGAKERLFAHPGRPAARAAGGERQLTPGDYTPAADDLPRFDSGSYVARPLRRGARIIGGTILGRIGARTRTKASSLHFEVRPAGRRMPRIDPKPILDGWKLLESTAVYRAEGKNPFFGEDAETPSVGQILLMSKDALQRRVLENPRIDVYACGRADIRAGTIDRRVLASLEFLASSGLKPTVTSLRCGHGLLTASGNVSHHSTGDAVDIAAVNGVPIVGNQGKGSITETAVRRLLNLQGTMKPSQIISLMTFDGAENTFAMGDHHDHIHVGWQPLYSARGRRQSKLLSATLKPGQWIKLIDRLAEIDNPAVALEPSRHSVRVRRPN